MFNQKIQTVQIRLGDKKNGKRQIWMKQSLNKSDTQFLRRLQKWKADTWLIMNVM